ncbi:MAG: phage minor capsid protein [Synergistaceae bacterium]|jgi:hypothetical protein
MRSEKQIQKLTDAQARALIQLYERGEAKIERQINQALLRGSDPAYLQAVKKNIATARGELLAGSREWCQKSVPYLYSEGMAYADEMSFSTGLAKGFGTVHQQAASALADAMYSRTVDMDGVIGRRVDDLFRALQLEAAEGTVLGFERTKQSAKAMREELAKRGITGFIDKAGRQWSMKTYTRMAVHDVAMKSFREGTRIRLLEHGYDLGIYSTHSKACPKCVPWQGVTISITGRTKGYPTLAEAKAAGMEHPGCRHVLSLSPEERTRQG